MAHYLRVFSVCELQRHESTVQREHHEILAGILVGMEKVALYQLWVPSVVGLIINIHCSQT